MQGQLNYVHPYEDHSQYRLHQIYFEVRIIYERLTLVEYFLAQLKYNKRYDKMRNMKMQECNRPLTKRESHPIWHMRKLLLFYIFSLFYDVNFLSRGRKCKMKETKFKQEVTSIFLWATIKANGLARKYLNFKSIMSN